MNAICRRMRLLVCLLLMHGSTAARAAEFTVALDGNDANPGTAARPFATIQRAQLAARAVAGRERVIVWLRGGVYYLPATVVFTAEDSGTAQNPVLYQASAGEEVVISGGSRVELSWRPFTNGIWQAPLEGVAHPVDQLFVNGERQPMARYPNRDPNVRPYEGYSPDAFGPERAARWLNPMGGYIHAMHRHHWGGYHYRITGKDESDNVLYEGGWQNNRQMGMHPEHRYVENIFEELDAPGEWFHDPRSATIYYYPPAGFDLDRAILEIVRLPHLVEFRGDQTSPVRHITLQGLTFRHAARTFMETREPLLRSDWTIYRGGAVVFAGSEDCAVVDSTFDQVGGNALFVSFYNRRLTIRGCLIRESGGNGIALVGDPQAVRNPLFEYNVRQRLPDIDPTPGPLTDNYPADCLVEDCLITRIGRVEKQAAGIQISMAEGITVRHCSIYEVPRAGINISEGTWGGHLIEGCDVFDTVLETGDHGSFNSWGRDRYWGLEDIDLNTITLGNQRDLPLLDAVKPTVLRHNRWRCDHGWDIDLDDGSSNYEIRDNLCLNGGIKLREGFYRVCENNIMVNNSFHPHVWYGHSQDVFRRNIVFDLYRPIQVNAPWGKECDFNLLHEPGADGTTPARVLQEQSGADSHSRVGDAWFIDPASGDYQVKESSPALELGFRNFAMDRFGVRKPELKAIAKTPVLPRLALEVGKVSTEPRILWQGVTLKNLDGDEYSAVGVARDARGVLVVEVPADAGVVGLREKDLIQAVEHQSVNDVSEFLKAVGAVELGRTVRLTIVRDQKLVVLELRLSE